MADLIIRRAKPADAEALAAIGATTFTETFAHLYDPEDLAAFLDEAYGLDRTRADLAHPRKAS
ncbi:MAG TPA: GNAT family N-acetyltransferase, partial [Phenylobacterium sp.]|nr:GNAT family N-acetyltransferase [Phenylobacterium sp.]